MATDTTLITERQSRAINSVIAVFCAGYLISFYTLWTTYYFGQDTPIDRISFRAVDPPWLPDGLTSQPRLGLHHFGDLELLLGWAQTQNPYRPTLAVPATYFPVADAFLGLFAQLPTALETLLYLSVSVSLAIFACRRAAPTLFKSDHRIFSTLTVLLVFATAPTIVDLDRGNVHTICISLLVLFFTSRTPSGIIFLLIAASLKPYYLIFLALYAFKGDGLRRSSVFALLWLSANIFLMRMQTGSWIRGWEYWLDANRRFGDIRGSGFFFNSGSLAGTILRWIELTAGWDRASQWLETNFFWVEFVSFASLAYLGTLAYGFRQQPPFQFASCAAIITISQNGSAIYQWGWVGFFVLMCLESYGAASGRRIRPIAPVVLFSAGVLIPWWIKVPTVGRQQPQFLLLAPITLLILAFYFVLFRRPFRFERDLRAESYS